jgi:hypothetical protein
MGEFVATAEKHPVYVGVGIFVVGLAALYMLGYIGGGSSKSASSSSSSSSPNFASSYYAAEAAQTQAGDALIANQQTNTAKTAQAIALDNANVAINQSYNNASVVNTANNNAASVSNTASNNQSSMYNTASNNAAAMAESNNSTALGMQQSQNQMATSIITTALPQELANGATYSKQMAAAGYPATNPNTTLSSMFWGLTGQPNQNPSAPDYGAPATYAGF